MKSVYARRLAIAFAIAAPLSAASRPARADCSNDNQCTGGPTRVMMIVDASSDMLNAGGAAAPMGATDWDPMRGVIAGDVGSMFEAPVDPPGMGALEASQVIHFGLIVFGSPGQETRVVDYGPCTRPNMEWALDPFTSCEAPGCTDPWSGPPITWTFLDGSVVDPPNFALQTLSRMPPCDGEAGPCTGGDRFVHTGVELATQNQMAYAAGTPFTQDATTQYVNILLVKDSYAGFSTPAEVQAALEAAHDLGIVTYVIGFGTGAQTPTPQFDQELDDMAAWGSAGANQAQRAANDAALYTAIAGILSGLQLPCCNTIDCSPVGGADDNGGDASASDSSADADAGSVDWGSAEGDGSASADETGAASASASASDGEPLDDDGGCTCATRSSSTPAWFMLIGFGWVTRTCRRRRRTS